MKAFVRVMERAFRIRADREDRRKRRPREVAGLESQLQRIEDERELRAYLVAGVNRLQKRGGRQKTLCGALGLSCRTVQEWQRRLYEDGLARQARGRPPERGSEEARRTFLESLRELPPGTGVPTLRRENPDMPRNELVRLKREQDAWARKREKLGMSRCTWTTPGRGWSADFARAPFFLENGHTHFLTVRDLATAEELEVCSVKAEDGDAVRSILERRFGLHGPPLVLKMDNGPGFISRETLEFLLGWGVLPLLSPPYTPRYNGSAENLVFLSKAFTSHRAAFLGRPGAWSVADLAWTRENINTVRVGTDGKTPAERAEGKTDITVEERNAFLHLAETCLQQARADRGKEPDKGFTKNQMASIYRWALRRALEKAGYLIVRRGVDSPVISPKVSAIIS